MSMRTQLATDLSGLFGYEMTATATIVRAGKSTTYTVILDDSQSAEVDAFGGPELDNTQRIHFQTNELPDIDNGTTLTLTEPKVGQPGQTTQKKKIVTQSVTSADGAELIVTVSGA
jgi:hypothetical protein